MLHPHPFIWSYIVEKLQYDFDGISTMQFIMWHVKRPLGRLYVERILLPNLKVVDNIIKPLAAIMNTQFSMRVTTSQLVLTKH
jgi:hypothetical protein